MLLSVCDVQVESLENCLSVEENAKKISDLETELEIAGNEVARLQKALEDMEEWKEKLVKESKKAFYKLLYTHIAYTQSVKQIKREREGDRDKQTDSA